MPQNYRPGLDVVRLAALLWAALLLARHPHRSWLQRRLSIKARQP